MKAPDKIYVPESKECSGCIDMRVFAEYQLKRGIEYIRKDALLEWAKECFRLQDSGCWYSKGAADAYSKVIDKLNSM